MISTGSRSCFVQLEEFRVDLIEQLVAEARRLDSEPRGDGAEELRRREPRIDQQDHRPRVADAVDERARQRRLPRSDLADEQRQLLLLDRVLQPRQRLACWALS